MQNLLELKNISYSYHTLHGETIAIKDISFGIREGEFVAVVGPSGCGKSTLLSIIAGLLEPEHGTIAVNNPDGSLAYPRIGYMLQHDYLFEWRSVYKNVILGLEINHMLTEERTGYVNKLLKEYDLDKFRDKRPGELSGGMKQRAALIRTLALDPGLLLLDEPFSALDYQTRLMVSADICSLIRATGKTMIIVTHDLSEAISIADRVIVLSGRPARVKCELPIKLTLKDNSLLASRNAPEFNSYFNTLWEVLISDE
ncbi:MAG: ABC transporter ATP-binding protein [Lachnospiraceae bacterium]|nr:ABC transporter ATP-binding protein [Lachnospiraceae bacterium]